MVRKFKIMIGRRPVKGYIHHIVSDEFIDVERSCKDVEDIMGPLGIQLVACTDYTGRACLTASRVEGHPEGGLIQYLRFRKGDKV